MLPPLLLALVLAAAPVAPSAPADSALPAELAALTQDSAAAVEGCQHFLLEADCDAARRCLLGLFPAASRTPVQELFLGNALYALDREAAYALHQRAAKGLPEAPTALLEWAMEQHRAGEYAAAADTYQRYLALRPDDKRTQALLADCLLHAGKPAAAAKAWEIAELTERHPSIDQAIFNIYGKPHPLRRRCDLWKQVRAGEPGAADRLLVLDTEWDVDWWTSAVARAFLLRDAQKLAAIDRARRAEIAAYASVVAATPAALPLALKKARWLGASARLPQSSLLASQVLGLLLSAQLDTPAHLLKVLSPELRRRAFPPANDIEALNMLAALTLQARPEDLPKLDKLGWDVDGDPRFAESYLAGQKHLSPDSPELARALRQFPLQSRVLATAVDLAQKSGGASPALLERAITAEFQDPQGLLAPHDSYRLKSYFADLSAALAK